MQDSKTISGSIVHITDGAEADARAIVVEIEPVQSGSGTPSPSNVRPITGWDDVSVTVTDRNLVDYSTFTSGYIASNGGVSSAEATTQEKVSDYIEIEAGSEYNFSATVRNSESKWIGIGIYDSNKSFIKRVGGLKGNGEVITQALTSSDTTGAKYVRVSFRSYGIAEQVTLTKDATTTTTTTTLPSTTYGGTIDLVSGVLTVDRAMVDMGTLSWNMTTYQQLNRFYATKTGLKAPDASQTNAICSIYPVVKQSGTWANNNLCITTAGQITVLTTAYSDKDTFTTAMNGVKLCYTLATPTTAQLTGQQIELLRDCFVWADSGDITLTYETELLDGRFRKIKVNGNSIIAPNDFELEREDVYAGEYTTCTGKLLADKIGWKYADTTMQWDTLPDDMLAILTGTTGAFTLKFTDSDGSHTENVIRLGVRNTATRFTDDFGNALWRNIELEVSFTNVH